MALIEKFEDLFARQEARQLTQQMYSINNSGHFSRVFGLKDQIRRAAVSTMANIAEGFDCESKVEFARFLDIARRSAVEVQALLYVAMDAGYIGPDEFEAYYRQAAKTKGLIGSFKKSLKK